MMVHFEWAALHPRIQQTSSHHCENMRSYVCCVYRLEQRTWVASQLQMNTHTLLSTIFVNVRCVCYFVGVIQFARVASMG